jgi:hypothetical protein
MCKKRLRGVEMECGNCRTDVSLLVAYVNNLRDGLVAAEKHTKAGELAEAVWAYLAVLEVDPDNPVARDQVGKVATAVRQFDEVTPGQRWLKKLRKGGWFRNWLGGDEDNGGYLSYVMWFVIFCSLLMIGYFIGVYTTLPKMTKVETNGEQTEKGSRRPGAEGEGGRPPAKEEPGLGGKPGERRK